MSETILRILVGELAILRILCPAPACGAAVEVPVHRLPNVFGKGFVCPVCGVSYYQMGGQQPQPPGDPLRALYQALSNLQAANVAATIEFVIPQPPPSAATGP